MRKSRIFYFAPVAPDGYDHNQASYLENSALRNKVLGVCQALAAEGARPVVVSTFGAGKAGCAKAARAGKIPLAALGSTGKGPLRRLSSAWNYLAFAIGAVRRGDRVILYNFFPEYILAALALRLAGRAAIMDIEDAPRFDEKGLRGLVNQISFRLIKPLCAGKQLIVSAKLAQSLKLKSYLPVYGVASQFGTSTPGIERFSGNETRILFGGSIFKEAGLDLFIDGLRLLASRPQSRPLIFYVTGRFDPQAFEAISQELAGHPDITLNVMSHMSYSEYKALLDTVDIGLSLKLTESALGETTFPSKVIEFGSLGLLLCATRVSDVPYIFDDQSALLLTPETPERLARLIEAAAADPDRSRQMASRSHALIQRNFSKSAVGRQLMEFLNA